MKSKFLLCILAIEGILVLITYLNIISLSVSLCIILIVIVLSLILILYYQTMNIRNFTDSIIDILDDAYNDNYVFFSVNDETIESKIQFKLNKLFDKVQNEINQAKISKNELQSLITDLSHQVKTPITNIKLYSDILKSNEKNPDNLEFYNKLDSQIEKLEFLLGSIIKISRLENNIINIFPEWNNINETIIKSISDIYCKTEKKGIMIKYHPIDYFAVYDEKWTIEAITNVLDNAVKYSSENSNVSIEVEKTEFYCIIKIQDSGLGIRKEEFNNIFKRFYRETDKHGYEGIGVGLYLTREILSLEHGYISVNSQKDIGSCFSLYLPIIDG